MVPLDQAAYTRMRRRPGVGPFAGSLLPVTVPGAGNFGFHPSLPACATCGIRPRGPRCNVGNFIEPVIRFCRIRTAPFGPLRPLPAAPGLFAEPRQREHPGMGQRAPGGALPIFNTGPLIPPDDDGQQHAVFQPVGDDHAAAGLQLGITGLPTTGTPRSFHGHPAVGRDNELQIQLTFNGASQRRWTIRAWS